MFSEKPVKSTDTLMRFM